MISMMQPKVLAISIPNESNFGWTMPCNSFLCNKIFFFSKQSMEIYSNPVCQNEHCYLLVMKTIIAFERQLGFIYLFYWHFFIMDYRRRWSQDIVQNTTAWQMSNVQFFSWCPARNLQYSSNSMYIVHSWWAKTMEKGWGCKKTGDNYSETFQ